MFKTLIADGSLSCNYLGQSNDALLYMWLRHSIIKPYCICKHIQFRISSIGSGSYLLAWSAALASDKLCIIHISRYI